MEMVSLAYFLANNEKDTGSRKKNMIPLKVLLYNKI